MKYPSTIELSRSALRQNISFLKNLVGPKVRFVSVIKGNAYGHGIAEFLPLAEECGVNYFAVFDSKEAEVAYEVKSDDSELMIMGMIDNEDLAWAIQRDISFFVFDLGRLRQAIKDAKLLEKKARIHIEVETGLHRTGFEGKQLRDAIKLINQNKEFLEIEGVCTHYAGAESIANYVRVQKQITRFNELKDMLAKRGITPKFYHTACSAASIVYPETRMDMVRVGIAQYGFWPSEEVKMNAFLSKQKEFSERPLSRVLQWKSHVMNVKFVEPGEFISYGNFYQATQKTKIATVPVGYYHGYRRSLSNLGYVLVKGK